MRAIVFLAVASCLPTPAALAGTLTSREVNAWQADLRFVQQELPATHPNSFHAISQETFNTSMETLVDRVSELQNYQIITELAAIIAAVGDGHTRLTLPMVAGSGFFSGHTETPAPASTALMFHYLPVRFALCDDGLYVQEADRRYAKYLGTRVERIGGFPVDEAMKRMSRVIQHDNDMQIRSLLPAYLAVPELLAALDITQDPGRAEFDLSTRDDSNEQVVFSAVPDGAPVDWVKARAEEAPLYLKHPEQHYWLEYLPQSNIVFCQYNEVYNQGDESIAAFSSRLTDVINRNHAATLVLDLRFNRGGDNSLNRSFLRAIMGCAALQEPGHLFVIIGRNTFSAAMMFALDLEKFTNAIFVGEPTGARPNHYGDSRRLTLPNSGLTVRVSTLYWQYAGPKDTRDSLAPHLRVPFVFQDIRTGHDPVLERILLLTRNTTTHPPTGVWTGRILNYDIVIHLAEKNRAWLGTIDFPGEGDDASGLPLQDIRYSESTVRFDFPNGDDTITFEGNVHNDTIVGRVFLARQVYPWVMTLRD